MKAFTTGLLKGRITRRTLLAALPAAGASLALAREKTGDNRVYRLGGAWIGPEWTAVHIPLDPAGRTAALQLSFYTNGGPNFAGLIAAFGADTLTNFVSQAEMVSHDTAEFAAVGYGTKRGSPPLTCVIFVVRGTLTYQGPDSLAVNSTIDVYPGPANSLSLPNADADGDGFPDPGVTAQYSIPATSSAKRITLG